jgi:hypothetical protein
MTEFLGQGPAKFAPQPNDSIRELRWKAESMLEYLRENAASLRKFPTGDVDQRLARWEPLTKLLADAMEHPEFSEDARLEAHRVWAEEMRHSALITVTMCVHAHSEEARRCFEDNPEELEKIIEELEFDRPDALRILSTEDMDVLRREGFLRPEE